MIPRQVYCCSKEQYSWINTGKVGGQSFDIAFDPDGKERREIALRDVSRVEITGPTRLMDGDRYVKNIWARAKVELNTGQSLDNVFLNITGLGAWKWCYRTPLYLGDIDDSVAAVTFLPKS